MRNSGQLRFLLCSLLTLVGVSAEASLIGAQSIRLTQQIPQSFQIAEIQVFELGTGVNVALQSNSGVASASGSSFGTIPGDANDGNTDGNFGGGSVWHSTGTTGSYIQVSFPTADLASATIYGRLDCCENRQDDFQLEVFDGPAGTGNVLFSENVLGLGTSPGAQGQIIFPIPEPSSAVCLSIAGTILAFRRKRRKRG